jgi:alpha 1,3-glucosidase
MDLVKKAIQLRYKMLPLWYTIFEEYHRAGLPVVRPLFYDFPNDANTLTDEDAVENQIMLGDVVLVHGVGKPMSEKSEGQVYLPEGKHGGWYDMYSGEFFAPGKHSMKYTMEHIPTFYRAGSIVPLKSRIRRSSGCMAQDPLTFAIYLSADGTASGRVYLDDYRTQSYQDGKSFLNVELEFKQGVLKASSTSGVLPPMISAEVEKVEIFGLESAPTKVALSVKGSEHSSVPRTYASGKHHVAVVKVAPWIDLRDTTWSMTVGS